MKSYADGILIFILIEALSDYLFYLALAANNDPFSGPALITVLVLDYFFFLCQSTCLCVDRSVSVHLFTVTLKFLNVSLVLGLEFKKCGLLIKMLTNSSKNHGGGISDRVWEKTASSTT